MTKSLQLVFQRIILCMYFKISLNYCTSKSMHCKPNHSSSQVLDCWFFALMTNRRRQSFILMQRYATHPIQIWKQPLPLVPFHLHYCALNGKNRAARFLTERAIIPVIFPFYRLAKRLQVICLLAVKGEQPHGGLLLPAAHVKWQQLY